MEFARSRMSGLLGFTIDQDGAVVKVDGLARTTGLQKGARVLQVEDKLIAYHPQTEIVKLLQDKNRHTVRTFVIPPLPKFHRYTNYHIVHEIIHNTLCIHLYIILLYIHTCIYSVHVHVYCDRKINVSTYIMYNILNAYESLKLPYAYPGVL